jgi:hypothetical protein
MKFVYQVLRGLPQKISTVALEVQDILVSEDFHRELCKVGKIDQSNLDGPTLSAEIKRVLQGPARSVTIEPWTLAWYVWYRRKTVSRVVDTRPRVIQINTYFLGLNDDLDYARTIGHETTHVVDNHSPYWFGHGDNNPGGDELTAPHIVGDLVARFYMQRRTARLAFAARQSDEHFVAALKTLGSSLDAREALRLIPRNRTGVHDYGTEFGAASKSSNHTVD